MYHIFKRKIFMKKIILFLAIALPLAFTSCSDDKEKDEPVPETTTIHEYVDLGLTSGTLWATCNVGADKPEEYGDLFAWGETTPKEAYSWNTYKWCEGRYDKLTKYCIDESHGVVDGKRELDPEDDAAYVNWGPMWRMPTTEQQNELYNECTWTRTSLNGVKGYQITGPNGKTLFLPAAGYCEDNSVLEQGSFCSLWSRSCYTSNGISNHDYSSCTMGFDWDKGSYFFNGKYHFRYYGHSVRAVRTSQN